MGRGQSSPARLLVNALILVSVAAFFGGFITAIGGVGNAKNHEDLKQLEQALRRAAVACYASEGNYPPNLEYLQMHYGVQIDQSRYSVHYDIFASNLMPDITVLEKGS